MKKSAQARLKMLSRKCLQITHTHTHIYIYIYIYIYESKYGSKSDSMKTAGKKIQIGEFNMM